MDTPEHAVPAAARAVHRTWRARLVSLLCLVLQLLFILAVFWSTMAIYPHHLVHLAAFVIISLGICLALLALKHAYLRHHGEGSPGTKPHA